MPGRAMACCIMNCLFSSSPGSDPSIFMGMRGGMPENLGPPYMTLESMAPCYESQQTWSDQTMYIVIQACRNSAGMGRVVKVVYVYIV